jgi:hypothetical protein
MFRLRAGECLQKPIEPFLHLSLERRTNRINLRHAVGPTLSPLLTASAGGHHDRPRGIPSATGRFIIHADMDHTKFAVLELSAER